MFAVAVLVTLWPIRAGVGVTGIAKLRLVPVETPAGMLQVTSWPTTVQPAGRMPMVRPVGIVSVMVPAKVSAWPLLVTVIR